MSEYQPVRTLAELELLDSDEIVEGYRAGLDAPFGAAMRAYVASKYGNEVPNE